MACFSQLFNTHSCVSYFQQQKCRISAHYKSVFGRRTLYMNLVTSSLKYILIYIRLTLIQRKQYQALHINHAQLLLMSSSLCVCVRVWVRTYLLY